MTDTPNTYAAAICIELPRTIVGISVLLGSVAFQEFVASLQTERFFVVESRAVLRRVAVAGVVTENFSSEKRNIEASMRVF